MTINELVSQARAKLKGKTGVGLRLPYLLGIIFGYTADVIAKISGRNLPVSSIRVKSNLDKFVAPFRLIDRVQRTLQSEFIPPDPTGEVFYTEWRI